MNILETIKNRIAEKINLSLGGDLVLAVDFVCPPNAEMGDLSLACFALVKKVKNNPAKMAAG